MEYKAININEAVNGITKHWSPQLLFTANDHSVKLASLKGDFIWHSHESTDEIFYCVSGGPFKIELSTQAKSPEEADKLGCDQAVELGVGDMFCVPTGLQHRPVADKETGVMVIEKIGTVNTGDREGDAMTVYVNGDHR